MATEAGAFAMLDPYGDAGAVVQPRPDGVPAPAGSGAAESRRVTVRLMPPGWQPPIEPTALVSNRNEPPRDDDPGARPIGPAPAPQANAPALDIGAITDRVLQMLARRQRIERERRGLY
jgi:hypothetical protein